MLKGICRVVTLVLVCIGAEGTSADVVIDTVTVGNPGNPNDIHGDGFGGVNYVYDIGKYEVTAGQYAEFLNAVAATDTYDLYSTSMADGYGCQIQRIGSPGSYTYSVAADWANRPVNFVSWGDAARFGNWLHNGRPTGSQGLGTTEDGSYFLNGATSNAELGGIVREPEATWAIPSEDEWYKAAYHKNDGATNNYFAYPTSSDSVPSNDLIDPDPGNNANFSQDGHTIGSPYFRTEVGEFENSDSPYGTYDQGGNVWEWTDAINLLDWGALRRVRGGAYNSVYSMLRAPYRGTFLPNAEGAHLGFRVAQVPEPGTIVMFALAGVVLLRKQRA